MLDRIVGVFSPEAELRRVKARTMLAWAGGGYKGGRRDRRALRNYRPRETSANEATIHDLPDLRSRSLDLERNDAISCGAISTVDTNVVGTGLVLQAQVDREILGLDQEAVANLNRQMEREFALATKTLDFRGQLTWGEMQSLALRGALSSGDIFTARRFKRRPGEIYGLKAQLIEGGRCRNRTRNPLDREWIDGVQHDSDGVPIAYSFSNRHANDVHSGPEIFTRVPIRDGRGVTRVLHLMFATRPDQARGVPYLAPVIEKLKQLSDYSEAEITAAVVSAFFTAFITPGAPEGTEKPLIGTEEGNNSDDELTLGAGAIVQLADGDKVETANPTRPNQNFDPFFVSVLRQIGMALELPFEVLIKHFTASYSASRAALEMAWQFFRRRRKVLADSFCQPIYEWAIDEAVAMGRIIAPGYFSDPLIRMAYLGAEWIGPARIQLDPDKESKADERDLGMGTKHRAQIITERTGGNFERKHEQLVREEAVRRKDGLGVVQPPQPQAVATEDDDEDAEEARRDNR